ncbi:peptidylprolyl isomerase [Croceicoccus naphthovorans]|uniref:Peptidyl-prolyl cis-trans isomerase n=1 Tax=Croceicoccus naphthovorans TaxID=1348774 RepID=A0A0G3XHB5_9SPHN|nr:peptidylprolyl isomerase [Croceicoccus naphthovorans]AKM09768.1 peptidylprolyl isomerase [Croceicoccus naphthovorans]MBB3990686.1 peptidylprolyl isomerase [Croceicoccus naphthovorans]
MNFSLRTLAGVVTAAPIALAASLMIATPVAAQDDALAETSAVEEAPVEAAPVPIDPKTYWTVDTSLDHDPENILFLDLSNGGRVAIRLKPEWAPQHVDRIKTLTQQGFYNGVIFHRVIEGFMAQTGDPTGTGMGGSELPDLKAEFNKVPHLRGTVAAARAQEEDSANSQFFIVFYPTMQIDRKYTNFGRVIAGMNYVDSISRGSPPPSPTKILQASLGSQHLAPPATTPMTGEITSDMLSAPIGVGQDLPAAGDAVEEAVD